MTQHEDYCAELNRQLVEIQKSYHSLKESFEHEVADRKRAEEESHQHEKRFHLLLDYSSDILVFLDKDGNQRYISPSAASITGFSIAELKTSFINVIYPDDVEKVKNAFEELIRNPDSILRGEYRHLHKNGGFRYFEAIGRNYLHDNELQGLVINIRDITDRKLADLALREKELNYHLLADNMTDTVWLIDMNLKVEYVSPSVVRIRGYSLSELQQLSLDQILTPASYKLVMEVFAEVMPKILSDPSFSPIQTMELEFCGKDGKIHTLETRLSVIRDENGKPTNILGIDRDISERKIIEKELIIAKEKAEESDRLKSAFLANMSHEIRTPMNGILGFAQLLKEPKLTGQEQQEYIYMIEKSGKRMVNIINDIVDISKIESGLVELSLSETNIGEQIRYIHDFFTPEAIKKGLKFSTKTSLLVEESIIFTDSEKLNAILINLVINALKFTQKGAIELGVERKDNNLEFFVKDSGMGVPDQQKEIIFQRFRQANDLRNRFKEGSGLGLAISKAYVEMLGGKIRVESKPGEGSIFVFTIPFNQGSVVVPELIDSSPDIITDSQTKNLKILIAEDDEESQNLIKIVLEKFGKEFLVAQTGVEAVEICNNNPDINLILMDVRMPGMDGYTATRKIRKINKDMVIIAQTAYGLSGDREKAIKAGCSDYIAKPIIIEDLKALIQKHFPG